MVDESGILARGPWVPDQVRTSWRTDPFPVPDETTEAADVALAALRERGSPSHDGLAARLRDFTTESAGPGGPGLRLECEPIRWALRLLPGGGAGSLSALCVVRGADGRWLAGRRAGWLATWAGRWALGAAGAVEVDEDPVSTLSRELAEEWAVTPTELQVEALVRLPTGSTMLIGQAWLPDGAEVTPNDEHDGFAWWPADPARWPEEADAPLRMTAALLA